MTSPRPKYPIPGDWLEENDGFLTVIFCLPNSLEWKKHINGVMSQLAYGRYWDERTGNVKIAQEIGGRIFESMAICEIEDKLERIAVALENIDQRQGNHITWEEFLDDLETAFGIGSVARLLAEKTLGLFPNFRLRYDGTEILANAAMSLIETHTRWTPLNRSMFAISMATGTLAAVSAAEKPLILIKTLLAGVSTAIQWTDFLLDGFQQAWNNFLYILGLWGGDEPTIPDPDNDPTARIAVHISNQTIVANVINACCVGIPNLPVITPGSEIPEVDQSETVSPTIAPVDNTQITWGSSTTSNQKCQAAHYATKAVRDLFDGLADLLPDSGISAGAVMASVATLAASAPFVPVIALPGLIAVAAIIAALSLRESVKLFLSQIAGAITSRYDDIVCGLAEGESVGIARENVRIILGEELLAPQVEVAMLIFGASSLTALFYDNPNIDASGESTDCGDCGGQDCPATFVINTGTGPASGNHKGTFTSAKHPTQDIQYIAVSNINPTVSVRFTNLTGWTNEPSSSQDFRVWNSSLNLLYASDVPPAETTLFSDVKQWVFVGLHPNVFSVNVDCD